MEYIIEKRDDIEIINFCENGICYGEIRLKHYIDKVHIISILVNDPFRHKGIGTIIMNKIIGLYGNKKIDVYTIPNLLSWYSRFAFEHTGKMEGLEVMTRNAN